MLVKTTANGISNATDGWSNATLGTLRESTCITLFIQEIFDSFIIQDI